MPAAAASGNGLRSTATRVIPRLMQSIGWSASPLAETRNYVQRVMENLQVYAASLGASVATVEPILHRVTMIDSRVKPTFVDAVIDYFAHPSDRSKP